MSTLYKSTRNDVYLVKTITKEEANKLQEEHPRLVVVIFFFFYRERPSSSYFSSGVYVCVCVRNARTAWQPSKGILGGICRFFPRELVKIQLVPLFFVNFTTFGQLFALWKQLRVFSFILTRTHTLTYTVCLCCIYKKQTYARDIQSRPHQLSFQLSWIEGKKYTFGAIFSLITKWPTPFFFSENCSEVSL